MFKKSTSEKKAYRGKVLNSMSTVVKWIQQNKPPIEAARYPSNPILINREQILLALTSRDRKYVVFWIYNTSKLKWESVTKKISSWGVGKIAYDKQKKLLYFLKRKDLDHTDMLYMT